MRNLLGIALAGLLALGVAGSAGAATFEYFGTLTFRVSDLPSVSVTGSGIYVGPTHISTIAFGAGQFGPITTSLPVTSDPTIQSVRISGLQNLSGTITGISGGPPAPNPMGLSGMVKVCLVLQTACLANLSFPLTPTASTGMGIGGTQTRTGPISLTMQHTPWTIGQPVMTIHTPNSTIATPALPGGIQSPFSATAQGSEKRF